MNKPAKTPRAPGRPAAAATVQREQLLSIATDMFAQQGIQATRLRAIAERAGVTPALLNYYFGSKERLVEAMVEERFLPLVARAAAQLQQAGDDPLALVEAFIRDMVRNVTEQPWLSQLWVREILCEGGVLRERLMHRVAPMVPLLLAQKGSLFVTRPILDHYAGKRSDLLALGEELFGVVASGQVKIEINQTYALSDAAQAHRDLEARKTTGSTILVP